MAKQEQIKRRIGSTEDLQSVVTTMKSLAAVNIRQYEDAADSLDVFRKTLGLGLQVVLRHVPLADAAPADAGSGHGTAIVFGSDQGMCGQFNEEIGRFAVDAMASESNLGKDVWAVLVIGERLHGVIADAGYTIRESFRVPQSIHGIVPFVQDLLVTLDGIGTERGLGTVVVMHNERSSGAAYTPRKIRLLPLDREWLTSFADRSWPTNMLPQFTMEPRALLSALIRQYLFVSLHRAAIHSLAGENASRLASMQAAEKNIEERLVELTADYHRERQSEITGELLDLVSGFSALTEG